MLAGCGGGATRPNAILIVIDTLRADGLSSYGNPRRTTPQIDALAQAGVRYQHAVSQAPWTAPSIASLLTAQYPSALGVVEPRTPIDDGATLLSEVLQAAGYATGAVVSHWLCSQKWGFAQGFDSFDQSNVLGPGGVTSHGVAERGLEFIEAHAEEAFFLFLHFFDPHYLYIEHPRFPFAEEGSEYRGSVRTGIDPIRLAGRKDLSQADLDEVRRIYDSEIAFTDHHVGRVLARLRELGLFASALVVVTADHGEEFLDHGGWNHARTLYDELLRVPLVIKYPDGRSGVWKGPVPLLDVAPTVLDALGIAVPPEMRGRSLLDVATRPPRPIFSELSYKRQLRSVVFDGHKLIRQVKRGTNALYDLLADPAEQRDLAQRDPRRAHELAGLLERWAAETHRAGPAGAAVEINDDERRALRDLGYLD